MGKLLEELSRRKVIRTATTYAVVSWLLVQVADVVLPTFDAPLWVNQAFILTLLVAFPVVLILSWFLEITPQGIARTGQASPEEISHRTYNLLNLIAMGVITFAVGFLFIDRFLIDNAGNGADTSAGFQPLPSNLSRFYINLERLERREEGGYTSFDFTPDGRKIAYTSFSSPGTYRLHTRDLGVLESETLVESSDGVFLPKISPDGQRVLIWSESQLFVIPIEGGAPRNITPDGGVVPNSHGWLSANSVLYTKNPDFTLNIVNLNGEEQDSFDSLLDKKGIYIDPDTLPDSTHVLYSVSVRDGEWQIHVVSSETGEDSLLVRNGFEAQYMSSGHIIFVRDDYLWAVLFDLESLTITGQEHPIVSGVQNVVNYGAAAFAVSQQGELIYLSGNAELLYSSNLVWVDSNQNRELVGITPSNYKEPTLSPDGRRIALVIQQPNGASDIWIYDLLQSTLNRLTTSGGAMNPVWYPDGSRLAFNDVQSDTGLYAMRADGAGNIEKIFDSDVLIGPGEFSPEGNRLIYIDGSHPDWNMNLLIDNGEQLRSESLLRTAYDERKPSISPDGRWLAYVSNETGSGEVYVRPFPAVDDGKWRISSAGGEEPRWIQQGQELALYYAKTVAGEHQLVRVVVDTSGGVTAGPEEYVTNIPLLETNGPSYAISPIDNRVLIIEPTTGSLDASEDEAYQAIYVDNWFEEVFRLARPNDVSPLQ